MVYKKLTTKQYKQLEAFKTKQAELVNEQISSFAEN